MKKNMGIIDRLVRILVAAFFAGLYFTGMVSGTTGLLLMVLGGIFLVTSFISFCPIYAVLGMSTCPASER